MSTNSQPMYANRLKFHTK